ncbi:MAG: hypothetical protein GY817_08020 [bacterium]|nr:hypothetical protein [bacterium]
MEAKILIPMISALLGALIGGLTTVCVMWIQQRGLSKREKLKLACEMAKDEHTRAYQMLKDLGQGGVLTPLSQFQYFHLELLTVMEKGNVSKSDIEKIHERAKNLFP